MANRKSMRGVEVDLAKLMARQEKNITVGNTKSNARGDQLGRGGRIVKSADELAREHYNRNDPKAVVHGGIKVDDEIPNVKVQEIEKPKDDWVEPIPTPTPAAIPQPKPAEASPEPSKPTPAPEPKPQPSQEEDPWVEDKDGNFVRQSELHQQEQNERVSKPKAKHHPKTSNKKKK
jgi:outer membrane biosynthesis protein TonB